MWTVNIKILQCPPQIIITQIKIQKQWDATICKLLFLKTHTAYNFMCIPAHQTLTLSQKETAHIDFYVTD